MLILRITRSDIAVMSSEKMRLFSFFCIETNVMSSADVGGVSRHEEQEPLCIQIFETRRTRRNL